MATIETDHGPMVVESGKGRPRLWAVGRASIDLGDRTVGSSFEHKVYKLYDRGDSDKPRRRSDLDAETVEDMVGRIAIKQAEKSSRDVEPGDVEVQRIEIEERAQVRSVRKPLLPDFEDDWPEDGSMSDKIRYTLENSPMTSDEDIAAGVGCSRSLVSDVKRDLE